MPERRDEIWVGQVGMVGSRLNPQTLYQGRTKHMNVFYRNQKAPIFRAKHTQRAQAIVEFAIVLPILMMILVGIFEVGRMLYTYAAVNNASREAARFGSALGFDDNGYHKYKDCVG